MSLALRSPKAWLLALALCAPPIAGAIDAQLPSRALDPHVEAARRATLLRKRLADERPAEVAWAAHEIARLGDSELVTELRAALRRCTASRDDAGFAAWPWLLDALIRLDARIEPHELERLDDLDLPRTQLIAFAVREPARHVEWLERAIETSRRSERIALWNVLSRASRPRAVSFALRSARIRVRIAVVTPEERGEELFGAGVACGRPRTRPGFPPHIRYRWNGACSPRSVAVTDGPRRLYLERIEAVSPGTECRPFSDDDPPDTYPLELLDWLAGISESQRPEQAVSESIAWSSDAQYVADAMRCVARQREQWRSWTARLITSGLIAPHALAGLDPLEVEVVDRRPRGSKALPALDTRIQPRALHVEAFPGR